MFVLSFSMMQPEDGKSFKMIQNKKKNFLSKSFLNLIQKNWIIYLFLIEMMMNNYY